MGMSALVFFHRLLVIGLLIVLNATAGALDSKLAGRKEKKRCRQNNSQDGRGYEEQHLRCLTANGSAIHCLAFLVDCKLE